MEERFDIPVVLFLFKRLDTTLRIIERIRAVAPQKVYLLSDAGRNADEQAQVNRCREAVERAIDWPCDVIKNYAAENRGVHANIGLGAKWVFSQEKWAIFLEDDNLPAISFFEYCKECLKKYEKQEKVFWICGTNYLKECAPKNGASVLASKHLMPCGWASWAYKFNKYYDDQMLLTDDPKWPMRIRKNYIDKRVFPQQYLSIWNEMHRKRTNQRYASWDFHTVLSIMYHDLIGIVPQYNQIENIGVDEFSTHGGVSYENVMTSRFCGIPTRELVFPLNLPDVMDLDYSFEKRIGSVILFPLKARIILLLRHVLKVPNDVRLREWILHRSEYGNID